MQDMPNQMCQMKAAPELLQAEQRAENHATADHPNGDRECLVHHNPSLPRRTRHANSKPQHTVKDLFERSSAWHAPEHKAGPGGIRCNAEQLRDSVQHENVDERILRGRSWCTRVSVRDFELQIVRIRLHFKRLQAYNIRLRIARLQLQINHARWRSLAPSRDFQKERVNMQICLSMPFCYNDAVLS